MNEDVLVHYMVHKKDTEVKTGIKTIINCIIAYVQNTSVYFKYTPSFF
jgi:hypothetical protein